MEKSYISNSAAWESQMMRAEQERQRAIKAQQEKEALKTQPEQPKNYNRSPSRKNKLAKSMAHVAIAASLFGGVKGLYDYAQNDSTIDRSEKQVKFEGTSSQDLDNNPDKLDEYELITEAGNEQFVVNLEPGDAIRTNDEDYTYHYHRENNPTHTALAKNIDDKPHFFEIKEGPIYKTPNGRIAVKSENLKETMSGEQTGIKFEKDSDEWSVIDVSPEELKIIQNFNTDK